MSSTDEKKTYPIIFTLTDLTGKQAQTGRTTVMWGTEVPRRYVYLTVAGFFPGMLAMAITAPFLGVYAFGAFAFVIISIIVMVEWRSRTGLKQRLYKTVYDSVTAIENEFILCGKRIPVAAYSPGVIYRSTVISDVGNKEMSKASSMPGIGSGDVDGVHDIFSDLVGDEDAQAVILRSAELPHSKAEAPAKSRKFGRRSPHAPSADELEMAAAAGHLKASEFRDPSFDGLELDAPVLEPSAVDEELEAAPTPRKRRGKTNEVTKTASSAPSTPTDTADLGCVDDALEGFL
ncbi:hypothetical protein [Brevibacterium antiquum]|uniref:hypothetical protein n=1 Tax=Brevibacterium antiquum TaxID=234835 RepID=UPI0018DEFB74|nr:hypothetical protein [Brevibacterium antiquum]